MTQLAIDFDHLSRRTDPPSSALAAAHMAESGALGRQRQEVLDALRTFGPATSRELAQASGICRYVCARRLPDLLRLGYATQSESIRDCRAGGRPAVEWSLVESVNRSEEARA